MIGNQITLASDNPTEPSKLSAHFKGTLQAEESGGQFPANLKHI